MKKWIILTIFSILILSACSPTADNDDGDKINIVATTTIVGDVVKQVGGDKISLTVLLPTGADPHTFEPRPQDAVSISKAQIIFLNGLELEHSLEPILESNAIGRVIEVSDGIEVLPFNSNMAVEDEHDHAAGDPHVWMDPNLVQVWVDNIAAALAQGDPENADYYNQNAEAYKIQLSELDNWIKDKVSLIPENNRMLVTDHESFGYFVNRYEFKLAGLLVSSLSSNASPSAQELADLEDIIRQQGVPAIFVDTTVNSVLAEQVAQDTGIQVIPVYSGSLGDEQSGADTYIGFMKTNVEAIVEGLK